MRFGRSLPLLTALAVAAVAIMVLAGAGTAASTPRPATASAGPSLVKIGTGPAAITRIKSYLRSVGIDPRTVVIQTGKHNYAGAKCPGKRWTCTTATRVFQASSDNVFQCTASSGSISQSNGGGSQSCVITQTGSGTNTATCTEHTDSATATQYCSITQSGRSNTANVNQQNGSNGTTQSGSQTAIVTQTNGAVANKATITQTINQDASGASSLMQDGWARANLSQTSSGTGTNNGNVTQRLTQNASGGTSQLQDTSAGSIGDCDASYGPTAPNLCANVSQSGSGGDNSNSLFQKVIEKGTTTRVALQRQGSGTGGIDGRVHQDTGATAANYNQVDQHKIQNLSGAAGSSQTQFDPMYCCGVGSQAGGNSLNQEAIGQGAAQFASSQGAAQDLQIVGESLSPNGRCSITQDGTNNAASTTHSASSGPPCPYLRLETSCSNGGEGGGCTASDPIFTPPGGSPKSVLTKCVRNISREETTCSSGTLITSFPQTIQYQLTYANTGTGTAHGVQVFDSPPAGFTFSSCSDNCVGQEGGGIAWALGDMAPGSTKTVTLTGTIGCADTSNSGFMSDQEGEEISSNSATTSNGCIN